MRYFILSIISAACFAGSIYVPADYSDIQSAVDAAQSGDVIILADGVWLTPAEGEIFIDGKDLTIKSQNGKENCFIASPPADGHYYYSDVSLLRIANCNYIAIEGITFQDSYQRAILAQNTVSNLTVIDCDFKNFQPAEFQNLRAVIRSDASGEVLIQGCTFDGNNINSYSPVYIDDASKITIDECIFTSNTASNSDGGAVNVKDSDDCLFTVKNSIFTGNTAAYNGGAIYSSDNDTYLAISNCTFENNLAASGGAIWTNTDSDFYSMQLSTITDCVFKSNSCQGTGDRDGDGGAIFAEGVIASIKNCRFEANNAQNGGAAISAGYGHISSIGQAEISGCSFIANTSDGVSAIACFYNSARRNFSIKNCDIYNNQGGSCISVMPSCNISRCRIFDNTAQNLIALDLFSIQEPPILDNCLIYNNTPPDYYHLTLVDFFDAVTINNCTIANNGGDLFRYNDSSELTNSIIYNNTAANSAHQPIDFDDHEVVIQNCCIDGFTGENVQAAGIITDDPQLFAGGTLGTGSPCIDAGSNDLAGEFDLAGNPRIVGKSVDIGAYEFSIQTDLDNSGTVEINDIAQFAYGWAMPQAPQSTDLNGDGNTDTLDLTLLVADWLTYIGDMPVDHLQCYYKFDDEPQIPAENNEISIQCVPTEFIVRDFSPRGRDATNIFTSSPWSDEGVSGGCVSLNYNHFVINNYRGVCGDSSRTITFWLKTSATEGVIFAWGKREASKKWLLRLQEAVNSQNLTGGVLRLEVALGNVISDTIINDNQWHHIAIVFDRKISPNISNTKFYIDGNCSPNLSIADNIVDTSKDNFVEIGTYSAASESGADAFIDEFRIYSNALTQEQILELRNSI